MTFGSRKSIRKVVRRSTKPQAVTIVKKRRSRKMSIPLTLHPNRKLFRMRYCTHVRLVQPTTDIALPHVLNYTSLHDPDATGGGHQPKNFDQIKAYYYHYQVKSAKITISAIADSGNQMSIFLSNTEKVAPVNLLSFVELSEHQNTVSRQLTRDQGSFAKLSKTYNKQKVWGNSKNDELTALTTGTPAENYYAQISVVNSMPGQTPMPVNVTIVIDYVAEFLESKNVGTS